MILDDQERLAARYVVFTVYHLGGSWAIVRRPALNDFQARRLVSSVTEAGGVAASASWRRSWENIPRIADP